MMQGLLGGCLLLVVVVAPVNGFSVATTTTSPATTNGIATNGVTTPLPSDKDDDNASSLFVWSQQWYPVLPVSYLQGMHEQQPTQPTALPLLGRDLVVWKNNNDDNADSSSWVVMDDVCPHRLAPLSTGKIVTNSCNDDKKSKALMCRFHGWQFASNGTCTDIPMAAASSFESNLASKFRVPSYPTQVKGGLLWVYLGQEASDDASSLPEISSEALVPYGDTAEWAVMTFPVSYMSMMENSFDPSHAPFIHEGIQKYKPETAIPMTEYQLVPNTTMSMQGFTMRHTAYQSQDGNSTMTRQFLPPITQKTTFPAFSIILYNIPQKLRETLILTAFPLPQSKVMKYLPKPAVEWLLDCLHFWFLIKPTSRRFQLQDSITMRQQDSTKLRLADHDYSRVTTDRVPTPADAGVKTFQTWMRKFTKGPPLTDPVARVTLESLSEPALGSLWDRHGQYCPRCHRIMDRLHAVQRRMKVASRIVLSASVVWTVVKFLVVNMLWNKHQPAFAAITTTPLVVGILLSLLCKSIGRQAKALQDQMHQSNDQVDLKNVYAY